MGKVCDLEKEKQKAKEKDKGVPPLIGLKGKGGTWITPILEMGPDGEWQIKNPEAIKALLKVNWEELGKEEEPKED